MIILTFFECREKEIKKKIEIDKRDKDLRLKPKANSRTKRQHPKIINFNKNGKKLIQIFLFIAKIMKKGVNQTIPPTLIFVNRIISSLKLKLKLLKIMTKHQISNRVKINLKKEWILFFFFKKEKNDFMRIRTLIKIKKAGIVFKKKSF